MRLTLRASVAAVSLSFLAGCGSGSSGSGSTPSLTYTAAASPSSASFATGAAQAPAPVVVTLTNTGSGALAISGVAIGGTNPTSFTQTNTCGTSLAAGAACTATVSFVAGTLLTASATLSFSDNATGSPQTVSLQAVPVAATYSLSLSASALTFPSTTVGYSSAAQNITFTNTGSGALILSNVVVSGTNSSFFTETATTCGASLAAAATCTATIVFTPTGSGPATAVFTVTDNASTSPQTVAFAGTGTATPPALATVDCSVATGFCPNTFGTTGLASDAIAAGGFHGYADPSERKDPNSGTTYYAYSWAKTLTDGTHVVDLHLAQSTNNGATFTYVGPLYQSAQTTQTASTAYSSVNDSSTETVDLLPIPLTGVSAGQTLWVQSHQSYLVAPQGGIYDQLNPTAIVSVTAVQLATPTAAGSGTALLALGAASTPEARLGVTDTDPTRNPTLNLATLVPAAAKCGNFGQSALWYQGGTLYLALECTEITGGGGIDANELAHFVFSTTPTGSDASKWTWAYTGEILTAAQAAKLGAVEGTTYSFFTEPEFALTQSGKLVVIASMGVFAPMTATQPVIQYGCRVIPVLSLTPAGITLDIDATTSAPVVIAKITENDLYTGVNEGPAACTYEPAAVNGIIMGRKYENDPSLGFYLYPTNSGILP